MSTSRRNFIKNGTMIALAAGVEIGNALVAHPQQRTGLCPGIDLDGRCTCQCRHLDLGTQSGLRETDFKIEDDIVAVADKVLVLLLFDQDDEITGGTPMTSKVLNVP